MGTVFLRQRRGCDLDPDSSALESSTLTTRLPSHPVMNNNNNNNNTRICIASYGRNFRGAGARQCATEKRKRESPGEEECLEHSNRVIIDPKT